MARDIQTEQATILWDPADVPGSLKRMKDYVESEATKAIAWYWAAKRSKAAWSRTLRVLAIVFSTAAGIVPIAVAISAASKDGKEPGPTGLWVSLLLGLAAGIVGFDHFFGFSSGWIRYVITATGIQNALEEFRMDWGVLSAHLATPPTTEQVAALVERAKAFRVAVSGMVLDETKAWATEFQSNMAQLEKDVKASFEEQRTKAEQDMKARNVATRPGSIELKVPNALTADGHKFTVLLDGTKPPTPEETVEGSTGWSRTMVLPGQYRLIVSALRKGEKVQASKIVKVEPDAISSVDMELPELPAATP